MRKNVLQMVTNEDVEGRNERCGTSIRINSCFQCLDGGMMV